MKSRVGAWFACALLFLAPAYGGAQSRPLRATGPPPGARVLVMPFAIQADAGSAASAAAAWLGEAAAILVADDLEALGLQPVPRDERVGAFDRLQLPLTSPLTRATTIRVGDLLDVSEIVVGEVHAAQSLSVRARLIRLDRGEQVADVRDQDAPGDLGPLFARMSERLARASGRPLAAAPPNGTREPPLPPAVLENYVKGLIAVAPATRQRFLEAAYQGAQRDGRVLTALWSVYTDQAEHAKALAAVKNVPTQSPLAQKARFLSALSLIELDRLNEAFKVLTDLEAERQSPALSSALGVVQLRRSNQAQGPAATALFQRAVQSAPQDTDYLFNLGYADALAHDAASALFWLRQAVRFDATDGDAHRVMSSVLSSTGKTVEAQRELDLATLLGSPLVAGARRDQVPAGLERLPAGLEPTGLRRLVAVGNPAQRDQQAVAEFQLGEGRRLFAAQRDREAIDALRHAVYLSPYEDEPHLLLGRLYDRGGRLLEAIDEFKVAIWCRESVEARLALATALLASGDRDGARAEAQRVLALRPDSADARALLDKIGK